jgi:Domain of unknown function (DUF4082)
MASFGQGIYDIGGFMGYSLFTGLTPLKTNVGHDSPVEIGERFVSSLPGQITALSFYKFSGNTGVHVGNLWSSSGDLLASITYTNETASGWQTQNLSSPVSILADTVYTVSYHTNVGYEALDQNYFSKAYSLPPFSVAINGGAYSYGSSSSYPVVSDATNYYADVVFAPSVSVSISPLSLSLGIQLVGSPGPWLQVEVLNASPDPLTITSLILIGTNLSEFLIGALSGFSSSTLPVSLAAGAQGAISVGLSPSTGGVKNASLAIATSAGTYLVGLSGYGVLNLV